MVTPVRLRRGDPASSLNFDITLAACMYVPLRQGADFRTPQYFASHRERSPDTAKAVETNHASMDREQGRVVLGNPLANQFSSGRWEERLLCSGCACIRISVMPTAPTHVVSSPSTVAS